jgi:chloride channel protein, CIC family
MKYYSSFKTKMDNLYATFLIWKARNINENQLILILSFIIGILGGLAAIILKNWVAGIHHFLISITTSDRVNLLYLAFPVIGIMLTVSYVRFSVKDNISHGISRILFAISKKRGVISRHNTYSSLIASAITVGFGGSVGVEAPIALTGSAIGSNLGQLLRLSYKHILILIGCGSAAAVAGIFKAPIAAVVFSLEVLMLDLTMSSVVPLLISSVTAATLSYFLLGKSAIFYFTLHQPFVLKNFPFYIILGILSGFVSYYFSKGSGKIESLFSKIENPIKKIAIGGAILSILIFLFPPLYGEGYEALRNILTGNYTDLANGSFFYSLKNSYWIFIGYLLLILLFKVIAMAVTNGSGGVGGIFAPSLFMGGITGFIVSKFINLSPYANVSEQNFSLVGMAGVMAGVMHAPLTSIFLIAEITGGYDLFIPLMITSTCSYLTIIYFEPHSIYTKRLAARGELITHNKDKAVLTLLNQKSLIERDFKVVSPNQTLGELVTVISKSRRNIFPVKDESQHLLGVIYLDDIREIIFQPDKYSTIKIKDLMVMPPAYIFTTDSMIKVIKKFEATRAWNLPVIKETGEYVGYISKSKIFSAYRKVLIECSDE